MDPTTTFCPNMACPARGQTGQGNIGIHSRKDRRFICTQCRKTFAATYGTVFYRLRTAGDLVALILTKSAEKPRHSCRGWIGVGRAGLNAKNPNKTHP